METARAIGASRGSMMEMNAAFLARRRSSAAEQPPLEQPRS